MNIAELNLLRHASTSTVYVNICWTADFVNFWGDNAPHKYMYMRFEYMRFNKIMNDNSNETRAGLKP